MTAKRLEAGTLWERLTARTALALESGAIRPIPTRFESVEQAGVRFVVRVVSNLARKDVVGRERARRAKATGEDDNPFLPYEKDLFVADISETHVGLLNKFNVLDHHLLIVTREFEDQEALLTLEDFEAMWLCMAEFDGLAFYNAGEIAGASQRHKHLQMVPLPLGSGIPGVPIEPLVRQASPGRSPASVPGLPFRHAVVSVVETRDLSANEAAESTFERYRAMMRLLNVGEKPYNLLVTRTWMMLVPRSRHCFRSIPVNSLGFAGALLVRNRRQMAVVKDHGPLELLRSVAITDDG